MDLKRIFLFKNMQSISFVFFNFDEYALWQRRLEGKAFSILQQPVTTMR